ncbi:flagellar M-ring protein FliF [Robbsia andropogonis]|uniref:Flagellar M-ring protein n=1 Tax=Robbsia andropogonis TaxID=28092 RepID=A0A0F5K2Q5_9BURK|nr:flagellar basal-body MS-ring/collar protein FliF [Robbsia andropogonis]KKB64210.1 flagellar M-ring protein FliF [Robbsia andropogonis]MCP1118772.1 flagellar M-ring protein FliF [Robbsia andropogonis]MCP1128239.1 flagellar M-ring protein FliF [Robbsia andropogonis]
MSTPPVAAGAGAMPQATAVTAPVRPGQTVDVQPVQQPLIDRLRANPKIPLIISAAFAVAMLAALYMWMRTPDYRVLFSNLSDRDGGAIIQSLQQMQVPYKFAEGGGAILVPSDSVHDVRLRLAQQGLPKGGSVGFELMDNEKFGISQFVEQVNYQRSLEGELERTIGAISAIQSARVHLAMPKQSVFVRDQQKPSASVLLNLYPGRALSDAQASAIVHLVSSAVPDMPTANITVVDQNGNLLTGSQSAQGLDARQLKYVQQIQDNARQRIEAILAPIYGAGNVHAQVSADIDFAQSEQTSETYRPNPASDASIRSQQTTMSSDSSNGANSGGVPGALSNEPPANPTTPITNAGPNGAGAQGASAVTTATNQANAAGPTSVRRDSTTNYELDKTVRHSDQPMGGIIRMSAAVVVNYMQKVDAKGVKTLQPATADQITQTTALVKDAMGFDAKRGDSVNVVNAAFDGSDAPLAAALPLWKQPGMIDLGLHIGKYVLGGLVAMYLFFGVLRPSMRKLFRPEPPPTSAAAALEGGGGADGAAALTADVTTGDPDARVAIEQNSSVHAYERDLEFARQIARSDPKVVATVVKSWISDER